MAGVYNGQWIPFQDQLGRQGWYNQATGQTTYQMYGGYNGNAMMGQQPQVPMQPQQMYQQPQMQVPPGYMPPGGAQILPQMPQQIPQMPPQMPQMPPQMQQVPQQVPGGMTGWQTMVDRSGRRCYYNPASGQTIYY